MKNYLSLCIWGDGPGRPYDNVYILKYIDYSDDNLHLYFNGDEECIIENAKNVVISEKGIKITSADKITWKFYYYGIPKSEETLTIIEYTLNDNAQVYVLEKGVFNSEKSISIKDRIALYSYGDIASLLQD